MLTNYLKIAFRNMRRNKLYTGINIGGLAAGLACFILIALWIQDELSYDRFHENADEIYRIVYRNSDNFSAVTHYPLGEALQKSFPEIENAIRIEGSPRMLCRYENKVFYEDRIMLADPALFDIFSFPFTRGNPESAFIKPGDLIITERMAAKYFGEEDPLGKTILINDQFPGIVTGVVQNVPANSHLQFDFLVPISILNLLGTDMNSWNSTGIYTYVQLDKRAELRDVEQKLAGFLREFLPESETTITMQPVTRIYLFSSGFEFDVPGLGDIRYIYIFSIVAVLILLIACMNYMNLATARSLRRSREIGVRKVAGADRLQLIRQFFGESTILVLLALGLALFLVELAMPSFRQLTGKTLSIEYGNPLVILFLLSITVLTGLLSGMYPAMFMSAFKPIEILKSSSSLFALRNRFSLRNSRRFFVVLQFTCSVVLIISTIVISGQRRYIQSQKLGFEKEHIIYFPLSNISDRYEILKKELNRQSEIQGVALSHYLPTAGSPRTGDIRWEGQENNRINAIYKYVDTDYLELLNTDFALGRNFSKSFASDRTGSFILNETAVKQMELDAPVGKRISLLGEPGKIVGVIQDAHFRSFHHTIEPMIFRLIPDKSSLTTLVQGVVYVKFKPGNIQDALSSCEQIIQQVAGNMPSEYHFLDQVYEQLYQTEIRTSTMFSYGTGIAIAIACVGLIGLSSFLIEQRTREIGIRKVLGASEPRIVFRLSREFSVWIMMANFIAWPVAWYAMSKWLQNFAYRIDLTIWPFLLSGLAALGIALLTVSWQAVRAATANPVESLRYE